MEMFLQKLGLILENKVCTFNFKIAKNVIINRKHNSFLKPFSPKRPSGDTCTKNKNKYISLCSSLKEKQNREAILQYSTFSLVFSD